MSGKLTFIVALICCCGSICRATIIQTPDTTVSALGHTYYPGGAVAPKNVADWATGGFSSGNLGAYTQTAFNATLTGQDTLIGRIAAPTGKKFVVTPEAGASNRLNILFEWQAPGGDFGVRPTSVSVSFEGLTGTQPAYSSSSSGSVEGGGGLWIRFDETLSPTAPFTFTAVKVQAAYFYGIANPALATFTPGLLEFGMTSVNGPDATLMTIQSIPEPATGAILALGLLCQTRRRPSRSGITARRTAFRSI